MAAVSPNQIIVNMNIYFCKQFEHYYFGMNKSVTFLLTHLDYLM